MKKSNNKISCRNLHSAEKKLIFCDKISSLFFISIAGFLILSASCKKEETAPAPSAPPLNPQSVFTPRNKFYWPFDKTSIWNMPIGSNAIYKAADFGPLGLVYADAEYIYQSSITDPLQPVYLPAGFGPPRVPAGITPSYVSIYLPDNYIVPDATLFPFSTPNNAAAMIDPDSITYYELEPFTRPDGAGKVYAYNASRNGVTTQNIKGDGRWGAHFGSGLSTLGGSIRVGEINGSAPISHALKLEFDTHMYWKNPVDASKSYRWPADNCDGNTANYGIYNTTNQSLAVGALLAIPPDVTITSLNLQTAQARKIFYALQDYGAYIVDASGDGYKPNGGYSVLICAEKKVIDTEFSFDGTPTENVSWFNDFKALINALKVVDNNTPVSIGGGGIPRQTMAPDFSN